MRFALFLSMLPAVFSIAAESAIAAASDVTKPGAATGKSTDRGGARPADPLANLKPYEERRMRADLADCAKETGAERRVCERIVRRDAEAKSRRRGAAGY